MSAAEIEVLLRTAMKGEFSSLSLTFNDHACNYCDVKQAVDDGLIDDDSWATPEDREMAIATNRVWTLQWYPDTPVGFYRLHAATLDSLLCAFQEHSEDA